jgi:micrococcal nuclease
VTESARPAARVDQTRASDRLRSLVAIIVVAVPVACASPAPSVPAEMIPATPPRTATPTGRTATPSPPPAAPASPTAAATAVAPRALRPTGPTERAVVTSVADGDTISVRLARGRDRVRYIGVDSPETVDPSQPDGRLGREATDFNRELLDRGDVLLEADLTERDRYGRLLRYAWVMTSDDAYLLVNLELVRAGLAQVSTYPPDVKYVEHYLAAQAEARREGRGIWGDSAGAATPAPTPPGTMPTTVAGSPTPIGFLGSCDAAYPTVCIPPPPPDLDCADVPHRRFAVLAPDPHRFDGDHDGIGCER